MFFFIGNLLSDETIVEIRSFSGDPYRFSGYDLK
jgi:hypothetical protein